jgi:hypothetical protein
MAAVAARWPLPKAAIWLAIGTALLVSSFALAQSSRNAEPPRAIAVKASPIGSFDIRVPSRVSFGALEFRSGLELTSTDKDFGGLSALRLAPDGEHLLTLSDKDRWFRGRIVYRDGRPDGIAEVGE